MLYIEYTCTCTRAYTNQCYNHQFIIIMIIIIIIIVLSFILVISWPINARALVLSLVHGHLIADPLNRGHNRNRLSRFPNVNFPIIHVLIQFQPPKRGQPPLNGCMVPRCPLFEGSMGQSPSLVDSIMIIMYVSITTIS